MHDCLLPSQSLSCVSAIHITAVPHPMSQETVTHTFKILMQPVISLLGCLLSTQKLINAVVEQARTRLGPGALGVGGAATVPTWLSCPGVLGAVAASAGEQEVVHLLDIDSLPTTLMQHLDGLGKAAAAGQHSVSPASLTMLLKDLVSAGDMLAATIQQVVSKLLACTASEPTSTAALWRPMPSRGAGARHLGHEELGSVGQAVTDCLEKVLEQQQFSSGTAPAQPLLLFEMVCVLHHIMAWLVWAIAPPL
jgi:hypothetical protein